MVLEILLLHGGIVQILSLSWSENALAYTKTSSMVMTSLPMRILGLYHVERFAPLNKVDVGHLDKARGWMQAAEGKEFRFNYRKRWTTTLAWLLVYIFRGLS